MSAHDPLLGTVIDLDIELVEVLGEGGMATVYRGRQRSLGREVAVKVMANAPDCVSRSNPEAVANEHRQRIP
jgi:hypothetical protein